MTGVRSNNLKMGSANLSGIVPGAQFFNDVHHLGDLIRENSKASGRVVIPILLDRHFDGGGRLVHLLSPK